MESLECDSMSDDESSQHTATSSEIKLTSVINSEESATTSFSHNREVESLTEETTGASVSASVSSRQQDDVSV